jgi:hypothetical protein
LADIAGPEVNPNGIDRAAEKDDHAPSTTNIGTEIETAIRHGWPLNE